MATGSSSTQNHSRSQSEIQGDLHKLLNRSPSWKELRKLEQAESHSKMSSASKKKTRQYSEEYLKFGFILAVQDERIPFCLLCQQFLTFLKTVLEKDDKDVKAMPLSKNTVSRRIDEMGEDIEKKIVENLKTRKFSVQMDESTLRDNVNDIPMKDIKSCAAVGKKNGCLKLMKDANPEMILVHCVIHRQNLVAKNISPALNEVLHTVIKCVNVIKASTKCERLFKLFCEEQNEDHVRLLLSTEVRWLSKENCLKRFMELFDTLSDFLNDKPEMKHLLTIDGKASVSYLADIFEKLQGTNKTLVDAKAEIFGFITNTELCQKHINNKTLNSSTGSKNVK
ncbi:SCAN domain-containing protein 3 [Trichonephila clavipes]|nr:SCAN domain-containing protein 3 [Trichonephila clavipes]